MLNTLAPNDSGADCSRTDVLIVGAGPVGLALALELSRRGIDCRVVDKVAEIGHWWTRAMNMNKRTMEHMRRWGLADELKRINFVPPGWPGNVTAVDTLGGRVLASARADGLGQHRTPADSAEDALWVAQGQVQNLLLETVGKLGVPVTFAAQAVSVMITGDGGAMVEVDNQRTGQRERIAARYVVGCDGGRSVVRQSAGIAYRGPGALSRQVVTFFRAPDLLADMRRRNIPDSVMYLCARAECSGLARLIAGDRWEFAYNLPKGTQEEAIDRAALLRAVIGPDIAFEIERSLSFSYYESVADRMREGPLFIAGDAAHVIPPLGGHNLNVGFNDAVNLGWKLAHVLRGWAADGILDSYGAERFPMIHRTADEAFANYERWHATFARLSEVMAIAGDDEAAWKRRLALSEEIARDLEPQWHSDGTVLDQRYRNSPIVAREEAAPPPYHRAKNQPCAAPGHRAPLMRNADGVPLYDLFGAEYTLLDTAAAPEQGAAFMRELTAAGLPVSHLRLADPALRQLYGAGLALIRPDQQVVWRGDACPDDSAALIRTMTGRALPAATTRATAAGGQRVSRIDIRGVRYALEETGRGPLVLFGHGLYFDRSMFAAQADRLSAMFRCVRLDWPGHGQSGWKANGWSAQDLVDDMVDLIGALGERKAILVGLSQGGGIFARLTLQHPELVQALVIMGTNPNAPPPEAKAGMLDASQILASGDRNRIEGLLTSIHGRMFSPHTLKTRPEIIAAATELFARHDLRGLSLAARLGTTYDSMVDRLPQIAVPTMVLWGEDDAAVPLALAQPYRDAIDGITFTAIAQAGHSLALEQPQRVTDELTRFLTQFASAGDVIVDEIR